MKSFTFLASLLFLTIAHFQLQAQDDLLSDLRSDQNVDPGYVPSIFKSTRILNSHSVETLHKGNLDFRISHRFGKLNSGAYNFFGLDEATIRLGLEYGLTDRITVGIGRSQMTLSPLGEEVGLMFPKEFLLTSTTFIDCLIIDTSLILILFHLVWILKQGDMSFSSLLPIRKASLSRCLCLRRKGFGAMVASFMVLLFPGNSILRKTKKSRIGAVKKNVIVINKAGLDLSKVGYY